MRERHCSVEPYTEHDEPEERDLSVDWLVMCSYAYMMARTEESKKQSLKKALSARRSSDNA